jgi:hypothetical protein
MACLRQKWFRSMGGDRGGQDVRQFSDSETHTLFNEIGEVCNVGDCDVSAGSPNDAYPLTKVEDELERIAGEYGSMTSDHRRTSGGLSTLKRSTEVAMSSSF